MFLQITNWTKSIFDFFDNNPILNIISLLLAILGIVFTIYFYFKSIRLKLPTYIVRTVNLVKEKIQKIESVQILYSGEKVDNLSISKIAFWNNGKETIDKRDIAINNPLKVTIDENYEILEAEILYQKNLANDFKFIISDDKKHILISFDYFDFEEGIVLQIFHTGDSSDDLNITETVKSVKSIKRKEILNSFIPSIISKILRKDNKKIARRTRLRILGWTVIILGILISISFFLNETKIKPITQSSSPVSKYLGFLLGIPYIYLGYIALKRHIPKGFNIFLEEF